MPFDTNFSNLVNAAFSPTCQTPSNFFIQLLEIKINSRSFRDEDILKWYIVFEIGNDSGIK